MHNPLRRQLVRDQSDDAETDETERVPERQPRQRRTAEDHGGDGRPGRERKNDDVECALDDATTTVALRDAGQAQDAERDPESDPSGRAGAEPPAANDDRAAREEEEQI